MHPKKRGDGGSTAVAIAGKMRLRGGCAAAAGAALFIAYLSFSAPSPSSLLAPDRSLRVRTEGGTDGYLERWQEDGGRALIPTFDPYGPHNGYLPASNPPGDNRVLTAEVLVPLLGSSAGGDGDSPEPWLADEGRELTTPVDQVSEAEDPRTALVWVHVPNSGVAFLQTLLWTVCDSWPSDWSMSSHRDKPLASYFERHNVASRCPELLTGSGGGGEGGVPQPDFHRGVGEWDGMESSSQRLVGMFRRPNARAASEYVSTGNSVEPGCITKTLARKSRYPCLETEPPTEREIQLAATRLSDQFAFVGLTEEWNLSICLWHTTMGGTPHEEEFQKFLPVVVRSDRMPASEPGRDGARALWGGASVVDADNDSADEIVFSAAEEVFWYNVGRHGISESSCLAMMEGAKPRDSETEGAPPEPLPVPDPPLRWNASAPEVILA